MLEGTRVAVFATASLLGNLLPSISRDQDPNRRLLHLHSLLPCLPTVVCDAEAPVAMLLHSWASIVCKTGGACVEERVLAVHIIREYFHISRTLGKRQPEALIGSTLLALLDTAMGFATEQKLIVLSCLRAVVDIMIVMHGEVVEGRLVRVAERVRLVRVGELGAIMAQFLESPVPDGVKFCAVDAIAVHAKEYICIPRYLAKCRLQVYLGDPQLHTTELLYLLTHTFPKGSPEAAEIVKQLMEIIHDATLLPAIVVAFDSVNLSSIDHILDVKCDAKQYDLNFSCDMNAIFMALQEHVNATAFKELMMDNRFDLAQVLKYTRLYLNYHDCDLVQVGQLLVDLEDVVECAVNGTVLCDYLKLVNVFISKISDYQLIGAMLALLLPKLLHCDYAVRQLAFDNAIMLCHKATVPECTLRLLIEEYREHLMDACKQQFQTPHLYPHAPTLLSAIVYAVEDVWSALLLVDEILERKRFELKPEYLASLIELMTVSVGVAKKCPQIAIRKPQVTGDTEPAESLKSYNDQIVERAFEAAFNLLSSDFGLVKRNSMLLMEACCDYFQQSTDNRDTFLPMIHKLWDKLWCRLCDGDKRVSNLACATLKMIITFDVSFCQNRLKASTLDRLLQTATADPDRMVMLLAGVIDAGLVVEGVGVVERMLVRYPQLAHRITDSIYGDIAWYHASA